jgi:DHA1 family tetracycline resistance protein-like MFS transporter
MKDEAKHNNGGVWSRFTEPFSALLLINFTGALGVSIMMPFLVFLVHDWGGNALIYGLAYATYSVFQFMAAPVIGRMSDNVGRRRILSMSQFGTVMSWMIILAAFFIPANKLLNVDSALLGKFSLTLPLVLLFLSRALDGITGGNVSVANAYLADITPEEKRDERFGKMGVSSNLGYIIGPALAGIIGGTILGYELPVLAGMGVSMISLILTLLSLPKSKPGAPGLDPQAANPLKVLGKEHRLCIEPDVPVKMSSADIVRLPGIFVFMVTYFLVTLAFNFFYVAFPVQAATEMKWSIKHTGAFFSVMSVFMVVVQGAVLPRLSRICSDRTLVCIGAFVLVFGFLALAPASDWMAFAGALLIAVGNGLMWPPVVALMSKAAGEHQGAVQGLTGSVGAAASIMGLFLGGISYAHLGDWLFVLSAGLIFAVVILSMWFPEEKQETEPGKERKSK